MLRRGNERVRQYEAIMKLCPKKEFKLKFVCNLQPLCRNSFEYIKFIYTLIQGVKLFIARHNKGDEFLNSVF